MHMKKAVFLFTIAFLSIQTNLTAQGLNFDGTNDYVIATNAGPSGIKDRTVECWIKTSNSINTQQVLIDWGAMTPNGSRFTLNLINNGRLRIEVGGNGITGTIQVANGMWHHVAVTYNHTATTKASLYVDGVLDISNNFTFPVNTLTTNAIQLGRRNDGANNYQGEMDEVRIWDFAKTASQILMDMNTEFCTTPTGLFAYFQLNDGVPSGANSSNTTAINLTSSLNNGSLTNFSLAGASSNWVAGSSSLSKPLDNTVFQVGGTIVATDSTANSYTWVDCNSATRLTANRSRSYMPTTNSDFKVILQKGICRDSSTCYTFLGVGMHGLMANETLNGYPNPTRNNYTLSIPDHLQKTACNLQLFSVEGKLVLEETIASLSDKVTVDMRHFESGLYYVKMTTKSESLMGKIIVEK